MAAHVAIRTHRLPIWPLVALAVIVAVIVSMLVATSARGAAVALSGVLHNASGTALSGVTVSANYENGDAPTTTTTKTTSSGAFAFAALTPGHYTLSFSATSTTYFQYLGDTSDPTQAEVLSLDATSEGNGSVYLPVDLAASGALSGKVATTGGVALKGYTVRAYKQNDDGTWSIAQSAVTSSKGTYSMTGLEPIFYRLEAIDATSAHPLYAPIFSGGATAVSSATAVGVLAGKTSTWNFALGSKGSVSGTVTGTGSVPLGGVRVTAYQLFGGSSPFDSATALDSPTTTTAANGTYQLTGLLPGDYTLEFQPPTSAYGRTFFGSSDSAVSAGWFPMVNGESFPNANITLVAGATIAGTIKNQSTSAPLPDIEVIADYVGGNPDASSEHPDSTVTASDGTFSLTGLGPGNYDLYVGSNTSLDPSHPAVGDTSWIRQQVAVGPLTAGEDLTSVSIGMTPKVDGAMFATSQPNVFGGTSVGDNVETNDGTWSSTPTSYSYQWYSSNVAIAGATASNYVLRPGDVGHIITVRVTASNFSYGSGTALSSGSPYVSMATIIAPVPGGTISGTAQTGNVLTATPTNWGISGISFTFDWQTSPDGSTWNSLHLPSSPTLLLTSAVYSTGTDVRVEITGSRDGYNSDISYVTVGTPVATGPITMLKAPTVAKTGGDYTLVGGTFSPAGTTVPNTGVQWFYEGANGGGGGTDTYPLPIASYAGDYIYAEQTRTETGYTQFTTPDILVQTGVAPTATGNPAITGTAQVGQFLDAPSVNWSGGGGVITHQWQYKSGSTWRNITGATNTGYNPVAADLGRVLRVITIDTNTGFATGTEDSLPTPAVLPGPAPLFTGSSNTGTTGTGDTVTAVPHWSTPPVTQSYQWEYSATGSAPYTKIAGATHQSYLIPQSLLGKSLFVLESALTPGYTTGTNLQSIGTVTPDQLTLVKAATVKHVGSLYFVTPPTFSPAVPAPTISYAWFYYSENDMDPAEVGSLNDANPADLDALQPNAHWAVIAYVQSGGDGAYSYLYPTEILAQKGNFVPSGPITLPASSVGVPVIPSTITWPMDDPILSYQWQYLSGSHWLSISAAAGGHGADFTPTSAYLGHQVRVITTASHVDYNTLSVTSATTTVGLGAALTAGTGGAAPSISGTVDIGQKLTALPGTWSQPSATFHYQWAVGTDDATFAPITGATASTYVIPSAAYNTDYYQVTITAAKAGFTGGSTTVKTTALPGKGTIVMVKSPTIKHTGNTFTVEGGTWSPAPTGVDYNWFDVSPSNNVATPVGTDSPSYTAQPVAEFGHLIEVWVQPAATNYTTGVFTIVAQEGGPIEPTDPITLPQNAVEGSNLSLDIPGWNADNPTVHILWYRNGIATGTYTDDMTYTLGAADVGKTISAHVISSELDFIGTTSVVSSTPTLSNVILSPTTDPSIKGTAAADDTVTANPGVWNVAGLTYSYQWFHDDLAIPGATSASYTIDGVYDGQDLTVAVTASKVFYAPSSPVTSGSVTVIDGAVINNTAANPITITGLVSGNAELGHTVTATVASKWNMPVSLTYQWEFQAGPAIVILDGANGASFLPEAGDSSNPPVGGLEVGGHILLIVTASRPGHESVRITSAGYDVVS